MATSFSSFEYFHRLNIREIEHFLTKIFQEHPEICDPDHINTNRSDLFHMY